ncbi:hypothetical protein SAMN04487788_1938 [Microbacterium testaceum StLB037]|uniref:Acb2/Tad1 hairpin domain-containing protein n=1 Tax=Microbacterium testaceum (strain StLB037) TaxID=979556 RepID=A0A1H0PPX7_MICTS|nr:hypothetical protein [Microbacterium testaceum]SDP07167.1 hypothetical protein SAMN04487788_1938 [Microbacterium testaceum StLB037]
MANTSKPADSTETETPPVAVPQLPPELASRFLTETEPVTGDQAAVIRANAYALALAAEQIVMLPNSRERSLALTALEEALMWANKAVFA